MLAQQRRAAAAKAAALAAKAGASAYAVSEQGGGLTYGEVDAEDLLKCVATFCAPRVAGGFWDLGSGAGCVVLAAAHAVDEFGTTSGGVELQPGLHALALGARDRLAAWAGATDAQVLAAALSAAAAAASIETLEPHTIETAVAAILGRRGLKHALKGVAAPSLGRYVAARLPFAHGAFRATAAAWTRTSDIVDADAARADARGRQARRALDDLAPTAPRVELVEGDLFAAAAVARWHGAAVVLANVLLFCPEDKRRLAALLGEALRPGAWVLSTAPLDDAQLVLHRGGLWAKTSWTGGAKIDVYRVVGD